MYIIIIVILAASVFLFYASYCISSQFYVKAICRIETKEKIVALTFDDGPDQNTEQVLAVLKRHNAKAAFFCIGNKVEQDPEMARRIEAEGHLVGNHSYSHSGKLPIMSAEKIREDYEKSREILSQTLGHPIRFFRPPFGVTNPLVKKALKDSDYKIIGWNIRSYDTTGDKSDKVAKRVAKQIKPGSIILLHDRLPQSAQTLELILQELEKQAYKIVRIDEAIES